MVRRSSLPNARTRAAWRTRDWWRRPAVDLFAGCGGTSLGLRDAGLDVVAAVEINPVAAWSYEQNVGIRPIVRDIRAVLGTTLLRSARLREGECFLLSACPPCQGFSSQRRPGDGLDDPRNQLVFETMRLVRDLRPAYVLLENVPGLVMGVGAIFFNAAMAWFQRLGYRTAHRVVDAADFGVPQHRERVVVIAARQDVPTIELPLPTHMDHHRLPPTPEPLPRWRTVRDTIFHLPPLAPGETAGNDALHAAPHHTMTTLLRIEAIPVDGGSRNELPDELILDCHRGYDGHKDVYGRMWWDRPAPTLTGGCNKPSKGRFIHPDQARAVTLREASLLQAFPEGAQFFGRRDHIADQIGNAVPPLLARVLGTHIRTVYDAYVQCHPAAGYSVSHLGTPDAAQPR